MKQLGVLALLVGLWLAWALPTLLLAPKVYGPPERPRPPWDVPS